MVKKVVPVRALSPLASEALGEGFIDVESQKFNYDGVIRQLFLGREVEGRGYFHMALVVASKLTGLPINPGKDGPSLGDTTLPYFSRRERAATDGSISSLFINYVGPSCAFTEVAFSDLFRGLKYVSNHQWVFENKAVIIGARAKGIHEDVKFSPFGAIPGVEIHANLIDNFLTRRFLYRLNPGVTSFVILVLAVLMSYVVWWKPGWFANSIAIGLWGGWVGLSVIAFRYLLILEVTPILCLLPLQWATIRMVQQFYNLKQRNMELAKKVRELSIVNEVSQAVNFMGDLAKTLDTILSRAVQALGAERGSIMLLDDRYETLVEESVVFGVQGPVKTSGELKARFKLGVGVAGEVFSSGTTKLLNDISKEKDYKDFFESNPTVKSIICVPLQVRDSPIGVMNIVNKAESNFDPEDLQLALTMANQAAVVIEKARLFNLATIDGLTGLIVHRHFQSKLEEEFRRAKRYGKPLSLIMTDIDHFKKFNDTWGHQTGDYVLREVAKCAISAIRDTDVAARYGGEEFSMILPETDEAGAALFAERLRQKVEISTFKGPKGDLKVTISLGVSSIPLNPAETALEMIKLADEAMYVAKHSGRNQVRVSEVSAAVDSPEKSTT